MRGQGTQAQRRGRSADGASRAAAAGAQGVRTLPKRTNAAPLSATEAAAVTYMREEEKLARDVYTTLAATSGNPVFTRIAASEQRHMDALGRLITRYGLTDPAKNEAAGAFQNAELQRLYDELVAKGSASPAAAIEVGRSIEQLDIADLNAREATTNTATSAGSSSSSSAARTTTCARSPCRPRSTPAVASRAGHIARPGRVYGPLTCAPLRVTRTFSAGLRNVWSCARQPASKRRTPRVTCTS